MSRRAVLRPITEPRLELLETCWRIQWGNRTLTCGIYATDAPGVECARLFQRTT